MTINNDYSPRQGFCSKLSQALRPRNLLKIFTAALALSSGIQASPINQNVNDLTIYSPLAPDTCPVQSVWSHNVGFSEQKPIDLSRHVKDGQESRLYDKSLVSALKAGEALAKKTEEGDTKGVNELLAKRSDIPRDYAGLALESAARYGRKEVVSEILAKRPDIDSYSAGKVLEWAAKYGHKKIVMELLTHVPAEDFHTAMQNAKRNGHQGIVNVIQEFLEDEKFKRETLRECAAVGAVGALYYLVKKCKKRPVPNLGAGSLIAASNKGESCGICLKDFFKCEPRFSHEGGNHDGFHSHCLRELVKMNPMNPTCPYDQQAINPNSPKLLMERVMRGTVNAMYAASLGALGGVAAAEAGGALVEVPTIAGAGVMAGAGVAIGLGIREILDRRQFDTDRKNTVLGMFLGEVTALISRSVLEHTLVTTCATSALVGGVAAGMLSLTDLFDD